DISIAGRAFRRFIEDAKGVLYSSATFAKKAENLSLYSRAGMKEWGLSSDKIDMLVEKWGTPMLEIISERLASNGYYIRREIDLSG
ncbi:MAG: strawberry notch family protein, partial [Proteobacteria bacterium]|nr:strawberry notch family protein [Pseudomonadota bacterium]